jgi:hypothetical protein
MMLAPAPLFAATLVHATLIAAQVGPDPGLQGQALPDSEATVAALRAAQVRFERTRQRHLPWTWGFSGGRCDLIVGRFCYWDDDDSDEGWTPPEEPEDVALARHELLARLDSASVRLPGDRWIHGQRMRYMVEAARYHDAFWAVRECRAEPHWCDALAGYVLHTMGDFRGADSAFARALAAMPEAVRCEWTDLSVLLDGSLRGRYGNLGCAERDSLNALVWWLADPSYVIDGNERRTEHYARHVVNRLFDGSANPYGISWGRDNRELVLRYGWAIGWERERPRGAGLSTRPAVVGHHADGALRFVPPPAFVESPATIAPDGWELDPHVPRSRYAPRYAARFTPLRHRLVLFRRGDSAVAVAGFDLEESLAVSHPDRRRAQPTRAIGGLTVTRAPGDSGKTILHAYSSPRGVVSATVPRVAALVGIEIVDHADSSAGRARYWVDVPARTPDGFAVSEMLLLSSVDSLPATLAEAIPLARGSDRFASGEAIGIFWEVYGLAAGSAPEVRITVFDEGKGFFRRAAEWIGVAEDDRPAMRLGWEGSAGARDGLAPRAVSVRLPTDDTGRFRIRLEIEAEGQIAVSETEVVVRKQ